MEKVSEIKEILDKNLYELQEAVKDFVRKNMGEKGYMNTQSKSLDRIYFYAYTDTIGGDMIEGIVKGVRVSGENIQIIGTENFVGSNIEYSDEDFQEAIEKTDSDEYASLNGDWENCWQDIENNDIVFYAQTLMSIADSIEQYGECEDGE